MEWLQSLLDSSSTPVLTAFLLGLLTSISPCPLATNIAAIGFIGKNIENRRRIFFNGLLYTLGRAVAYTALGIVLLMVLQSGSSLFGIQKFVGKYGEMLLGPALLLVGVFMLVGKHADNMVKAVEESYAEGVTDEFIKPIVNDRVDGRIGAGHVVIFFNYRNDRAKELTTVLIAP